MLEAKTIKVPQDFAKIQLAIDTAVNGDTVLVAEGTYFENIILKKKIVLCSQYLFDHDTAHISKTIVDGSKPHHSDSASVILVSVGADTNTVIIGLTLTKGNGTRMYDGGYWRGGGGIFITGGSATIRHNIITQNSTTSSDGVWGGGIAMGPINGAIAYWIIEDNTITENHLVCTAISSVAAEGGGVWLTEDGRFNHNIVANNSVAGVVYGIAGGINILGMTGYGSTTIELSDNFISNNSASHWGGGIFMGIDPTKTAVPYVTLTNNIICRNSTVALGAAIHAQGGDYTIINNTIVDNDGPQAIEVQSKRGVLALRMLNNVVWNPKCSIELIGEVVTYSQNIDTRYNCIRKGYTGISNISAPPLFIADDPLYHLSDSSYCIARGFDSTMFGSTWYHAPQKDYFGMQRSNPSGTKPDLGALEHASGTERNPLPSGITMGQKFKKFFDWLNAAPSANKSGIVDSFFIANPVMPFIEDSTVHFLYRGSSTTVTIAGDFTGWDAATNPMLLIPETDLWYRIEQFTNDARLEYKFVLNGSNWLLDLRNPFVMQGGLGNNSVVMLSAYKDAPEIKYYADIPHGSLFDTSITSSYLGNVRIFQVYLPAGYNPASNDSLPVIVWHDANDWIPYGKVFNVLDYIIYHKQAKPHIAVLVNWVDRSEEYVFSKRFAYANFITQELMPYIDKKYRTSKDPAKRGMLGISFGGTITAQICKDYSNMFGFAAMMSPAYWANNFTVMNQLITSASLPLKIYVDGGSYEPSISYPARYLSDQLLSKGYQLRWNEWQEGHTYGNWRTHIDNVMEFLLPGDSVTVGVTQNTKMPNGFSLEQNYPNPFNPSTVIRYQLPVSSHVSIKIYDLLGREVATLVNKEQSAGWKEVQWNASGFASGVYLVRMFTRNPFGGQAGKYSETKKILLMK